MRAKTASSGLFGRYYALSKPGIIYANVLTAGAGYLYGSRLAIDWVEAVGLLIGMALIIASACAFNNYLDRGVDAKMSRTKGRALVAGSLTTRSVLWYTALMFVLGATIIVVTQNALTIGLIALAYVDYVALYGYTKRTTVHGTLVGAVSGSLPLMAGFTAATGQLDLTAGLLFALMTSWQMAHFYGIALYRQKDYAAASVPVMPVRYGVKITRLQIIGYMLLYVIVAAVILLSGRIGAIGGGILALSGLWWLVRNLRNHRLSPAIWGRQVFVTSLIVVLLMSIALAFGRSLP